jgi:hypothetical protein
MASPYPSIHALISKLEPKPIIPFRRAIRWLYVLAISCVIPFAVLAASAYFHPPWRAPLHRPLIWTYGAMMLLMCTCLLVFSAGMLLRLMSSSKVNARELDASVALEQAEALALASAYAPTAIAATLRRLRHELKLADHAGIRSASVVAVLTGVAAMAARLPPEGLGLSIKDALTTALPTVGVTAAIVVALSNGYKHQLSRVEIVLAEAEQIAAAPAGLGAQRPIAPASRWLTAALAIVSGLAGSRPAADR